MAAPVLIESFGSTFSFGGTPIVAAPTVAPSAGEIVILGFLANGISTDSTAFDWASIGFTQFYSGSSSGCQTVLAWKRAGGSEPSSYSLSYTPGSGGNMRLIGARFSGCITSGSPIDGTVNPQSFNFPGTSFSAGGGVTASVVDTMHCLFMNSDGTLGTPAISTYAETVYNQSFGGSNFAMDSRALFTKGLAASGAVSNVTVTQGGSGFFNVNVVTFLLLPDGGGPVNIDAPTIVSTSTVDAPAISAPQPGYRLAQSGTGNRRVTQAGGTNLRVTQSGAPPDPNALIAPTIASTSSVGAPTITVDVVAPTIASTSSVGNPTVAVFTGFSENWSSVATLTSRNGDAAVSKWTVGRANSQLETDLNRIEDGDWPSYRVGGGANTNAPPGDVQVNTTDGMVQIAAAAQDYGETQLWALPKLNFAHSDGVQVEVDLPSTISPLQAYPVIHIADRHYSWIGLYTDNGKSGLAQYGLSIQFFSHTLGPRVMQSNNNTETELTPTTQAAWTSGVRNIRLKLTSTRLEVYDLTGSVVLWEGAHGIGITAGMLGLAVHNHASGKYDGVWGSGGSRAVAPYYRFGQVTAAVDSRADTIVGQVVNAHGTADTAGGVNIGYDIPTSGMTPLSFTLSSLGTSAHLTGTIKVQFAWTGTIDYRINGGTWTACTLYTANTTDLAARLISQSVPLTDLVSGANTIEFRTSVEDGYGPNISNVDVFTWDISTTVNIAAPTIASTSSVGTPVISQTFTAPTIASTSSVGAPAVAQTVSVPTIASTSSVGSPVIAQTISVPTIASTSSVGSPVIAQTIAAPTIGSTSSVGTPVVSQNASAPLIASTSTVAAPALAVTMTAPTIGSTSSVGDPVVSGGLVAPTIGSTSAVGAPVLAHTVTVPTIGSTSTVGDPVVSGGLVAPTIDSTSTVGSPALAHALTAPTIDTTSTVGGPAINQSFGISTIPSTSTVEAPTLRHSIPLDEISSASIVGAPGFLVSVTVATIGSTSTVGSPTVSTGGVVAPTIDSTSSVGAPALAHTIAAPTIDSTSTVGAPAVSVTLTTGTIGSTSTVDAPALAHAITAPTIASTSTVDGPTLANNGALVAPTIASTSTVGTPTLAESFQAPTIESTSTVGAPSIAPVIAVPTIENVNTVAGTVIGQTITGEAITSTSSVPAPTFAVAMVAPTIASTSTLDAPAVAQSITVPTIVNTSTVGQPTVTTTGLAAPTIINVSIIGDPVLKVSMSTPTIPSTSEVLPARLSQPLDVPTIVNIEVIGLPLIQRGEAAGSGERTPSWIRTIKRVEWRTDLRTVDWTPTPTFDVLMEKR